MSGFGHPATVPEEAEQREEDDEIRPYHGSLRMLVSGRSSSAGALAASAIMTRLPYAAAARTLSPARIVAIPAAAIRELFDGDRTFARAVADELSRASHRTLAELKSPKMHTPVERLADWLLRADARSN